MTFFLEIHARGDWSRFMKFINPINSKKRSKEDFYEYISTFAVFLVSPMLGPAAGISVHMIYNYVQEARNRLEDENETELLKMDLHTAAYHILSEVDKDINAVLSVTKSKRRTNLAGSASKTISMLQEMAEKTGIGISSLLEDFC